MTRPKWLKAVSLLAVTGLSLLIAGCQGQQIAQEQASQSRQTNQPTQGPHRHHFVKPADGVVPATPDQELAESVLNPVVKRQLGNYRLNYNQDGAFEIMDSPALNAQVSSAPYVQPAHRNPRHGNRVEGSARAWLNKTVRQYQNRAVTGNGRGSFKPVGFKQRMDLNPYVTGYNHLYDRGHLLAYALVGNARGFDASESNPDNIVTQTAWANESDRKTNGTGQNDYEGIVRNVVDQGQDVMYVVTPIYGSDQELVPRGIRLQATSKQTGRLFDVFVPNVQKGMLINYQTGQSHAGSPKSGWL